MENTERTYDLYKDIKERCGGEIYIGVLGPVRTGKSTFIGRFMDEMVFPYMSNSAEKLRAMDELPQSGAGKTVTTTEPKFVPNEAANIRLTDELQVKVRLIDCVGYMVDGAAGHMEGEEERMVKTPWYEDPVPFTKAAEIGTDKVMNDHSTIGIVITTDGSIGDIPREAYEAAEEKTINAMKETGKPFLVIVNSKKPYSDDAKSIADQIMQRYGVTALVTNCQQLRKEELLRILEQILYEFPISQMEFYFPIWVDMLTYDNPLKKDLIEEAMKIMAEYTTIRDVTEKPFTIENEYIRRFRTDHVGFDNGVIKVDVEPRESYYYEMLTQIIGEEVLDPYQLMEKLKEYGSMKKEYEKVRDAVGNARSLGYGVMIPDKEEILVDEPEIIKQGNKYGVKIKAVSPSIHMIRANIETEISPIVGTKEQAEDLIGFIADSSSSEGMWNTNIFGKSVQQMVTDGIRSKVSEIGPECQEKLQDSMQKIVNDSNGGMVCIII